jgi:hypothetical protein
MEIIKTIGTILFALSALGFLGLAVFDQPRGNRQRVHTSRESESGFGLPVAVRLLRASVATLKLAAAGYLRPGEAGNTAYTSRRESRELDKVA